MNGVDQHAEQTTATVTAGRDGARSRFRDAAAGAAAYGLMFFFWAVAAGLSATGLVGFGRDNMRLSGPWPYLLFFALDGAAAFCAVLLMRRAARAQSAVAPRLAVWGLVAASAAFNWEHAPHRPFAPEAFALMPVIAGVLFEFALHETKRAAGRQDRRMTAVRWLHPIERVRVQLALAGDEAMPAEHATRQVRIDRAAHHLYRLRRLRQTGAARWRQRAAERKAQTALARAGFADEVVARQVLRQLQVLTQAVTLAALDYGSADDALTVLANLISATSDPPRSLRLPADGPRRVEAPAPPDVTGRPRTGEPGRELDTELAELTAHLEAGHHDRPTVPGRRPGSPEHRAGQTLEGAGQSLERGMQEVGTLGPGTAGPADRGRPGARPGRPVTTGSLAIGTDHPAAADSGLSPDLIANGAGNGTRNDGPAGDGGARVIQMPGTSDWRDLLGHDVFKAAAAFAAQRHAAGLPRYGAGAEFARLATAAGTTLSDRRLRAHITRAYTDLDT